MARRQFELWRRRVCLVWIAFACLVNGTRGADLVTSAPRREKIRVTATLSLLGDWVQQVGGHEVEVSTLIAPGRSPHTFEPSPRDLRQIAESQLFVSVGLGLDDWASRARSSARHVRFLPLGEVLKNKNALPAIPEPGVEIDPNAGASEAHHGEHHPHHDHAQGVDPHFWLDPVLARAAVEEIAQALTEVAPERADVWRAGAKRYAEELEALHREIAQKLHPCAGARLVTFHHAFGYFAHRYGLVVAAVIEEYPGKQPSESYLMRLVERLRGLHVTTIFAEPQFSPRVARLLAQEVGARVATLDPEGSSSTPSYVALMRANVEAVRENLCAGPAPDSPADKSTTSAR